MGRPCTAAKPTRVGPLNFLNLLRPADVRVTVLFQPKAWMAEPTMREWVEKVYAPVAGQLEGEKLLLMDNLSAHVSRDVRTALRKTRTLAWYLPPNCTDFLQPVDAGAGRPLMLLSAALDCTLRLLLQTPSARG